MGKCLIVKIVKIRPWRYFFIFLLSTSSIFAASRPFPVSPGNHIAKIKKLLKERAFVRVLIGPKVKEVVINGQDLQRRIHVKNERRKYFNGRASLTFNCTGLSKIHNSKIGKGPMLFASLDSSQGYFNYRNENYRGNVKILAVKEDNACDVINEVPLEYYLQTLLSKEMNSRWPIEALKAQAVAARTYAIHKMSSQQVSRELGQDAFYDIESSEKHQVSGGINDVTGATRIATQKTLGEVLVSPLNTVVPIFFHAKCGGRTLLPNEVWDNIVEGYHSVDCGACDKKGEKNWTNSVSMERFRDFLKWAFRDVKNGALILSMLAREKLIFVPDSMDNKKVKIYIGDKLFMVAKTLFRRFFGRVIVASNNFKINVENRDIFIFGKGLGHGVGMCQLGALELAQRGMDYHAILQHYFPGFHIEKVY